MKRLGGDGVDTPTDRTADQSVAAVFRAYEGTPRLCAPPRLSDQMTVQLLSARNFSDIDMARGLALVNLGMAEAGIAAWDSKFFCDSRTYLGIHRAFDKTGGITQGR